MHTQKNYYSLLSFWVIILLFPVFKLRAQIPGIENWELRLEKPFDRKKLATESIWDSLRIETPTRQQQLIHALEKSRAGKNNPIKILLLKGKFSRLHSRLFDEKYWIEWGNDAVKQAVAANNNYLLEDACGLLGDGYLWATKTDTALFYLLKALEIGETLGYDAAVIARRKIAASNALYQTQNYRECIAFCTAGLPYAAGFDSVSRITMYNNLGLSYLKTGEPDKAIPFFREAIKSAAACNYGVWVGIASGNVGDALHAAGKTEEAVPYWQADVDSCMAYREWPNAGLSLAYLAQYEFEQGKRQAAIEKLEWAGKANAGDPINLVRIYAIQARIYRYLQRHDSADYFFARHYAISDSLQQGIARGNFNTILLRLQYERNAQKFQLLQQEKNALENRRNLMAVALISLLVIGFLVYNRQRLQLKLEKQSNALAMAESRHAREQLASFTQLVIEKNEQIELLSQNLTKQQTANHDELVQQTLLTDYDWNRFRELFEKSFPGYFDNLKMVAPGITASEMRLAALIKLNLDNKQMACMQGISVSSVRGNKTRLRQKLTLLAPDTDLEAYLKAL